MAKNCVLRYNLSPARMQVRADAMRLRQSVMNLVINASEAIGQRSGVIAITTGLARVDGAYRRMSLAETEVVPGDYVFVGISDTGEGTDAAKMKRIFAPFFTKFTGRGLGLAAVLGIVRGHSGALKVYSEPGRGSTFKLFLPLDPRDGAETGGGEAAAAKPKRVGGHILVAADEETVRAVVARALELQGYHVDLVANGREVVARYRAEPARYRLVVLDLMMPHLDGEETFRQLRNIHPGVRVVLISGFNEQEAMGSFGGKGLGGFVQKPVEIATLGKVVNGAVMAA